MPTYGRLSEFVKGQNWEEYIEVMLNYLGANEIADAARKRQILLASVGADTYHLIKTLIAPDSPNTKNIRRIGDCGKRPSCSAS